MASTHAEPEAPRPASDAQAEGPSAAARSAPAPAPLPAPLPAPQPAPGGEPGIAQFLRTLAERRWTALAVAGAVLATAVAYLLVAPPVYESSVLIQIESRAKVAATFEDLARLFEGATATEGEIRMIRSRPLVEAVVERLRLDVEARPRTVPLVGDAILRAHRGATLAPPPPGLGRFAWGGERLEVERLAVPEPLVGERLRVTALEGGRYRLASGKGAVLLEGEVGTPARGGGVELLVSGVVARPGTEFTLRKLRLADAVERIQQRLLVGEAGRDTGLVVVTLSGTDRQQLASILDAISTTYLRQNVQRTSAEAATTLAILEAQLPVLKSNLDRAETALDRFRRRNGTVNLSAEAEATLTRIGEMERAVAEIELQKAELANRTARHPDLPGLERRSAQLRTQLTAMETRMRALPGLELESARLARQVRVATELYLLVLNRAQELEIVKSGWLGNARLLEKAVAPYRPVRPKVPLVLFIGALLGVASGVAAAFLRKELDRSVRDPDEIEAVTRVPVFATISRSPAQRKLSRRGRRGRLAALALVKPADPAVEDLRALRTSIQFALLRARNNVVAIGGLAPKDGKSFVSVNVAHLLAAAGGRILLVDGDLRRGVLHRYFGIGAQPGLADVLARKAELDAAVQRTEDPNLDVLAAGATPRNPAELLASPALEQVLAELGQRYKVVIVDTPPVLAVNDGALVGRHAGVNLLVLRSGRHPVGDVEYAVSQLVRSGVSVRGAVLNDLRASLGRYGRQGRYRRAGAPVR